MKDNDPLQTDSPLSNARMLHYIVGILSAGVLTVLILLLLQKESQPSNTLPVTIVSDSTIQANAAEMTARAQKAEALLATAQTGVQIAATHQADNEEAFAAAASVEAQLGRAIKSMELAGEAEAAWANYPSRALLLALESLYITNRAGELSVPVAEQNLRDMLLAVNSVALHGHKAPVTAVAFSPDGRWLVTDGEDRTIRLWNMDALQAGPTILSTYELYSSTFKHEPIGGRFTFSHDGNWLAAIGNDISRDPARSVLLWDGHNLEGEPIILHGDQPPVGALHFSPDGRWLAVATADDSDCTVGSVQIWDLADPKVNSVILPGHECLITSLQFSPDSRWLATGSVDQTVHLWDLENLEQVARVLPGFITKQEAVAFSPDGHWIAVGGYEARIWATENLSADPVIVRKTTQSAGFDFATFSSDGHWLAVSLTGDLTYLLATDNLSAEPIQIDGKNPVFSPDGKWLGTAYHSEVHIWNVSDFQAEPIVLPSPSLSDQTPIAFSPDGRWLASAGLDRIVRLWDTDNEWKAKILMGHEAPVRTLAFSPDDRWLVSAGDEPTIRLWATSESTIPVIEPIGLNISDDASLPNSVISPDGCWLAVADYKEDIRLWDLCTFHPTPTLLHNNRRISRVTFSFNGSWLIAEGMEPIYQLWNISDPQAPYIDDREFEVDVFGKANVDPDNRWLVLIDEGKLLLRPLTDSRTDPITLPDQTGAVSDYDFSPDGNWLAVAGYDGAVRLWDTTNSPTFLNELVKFETEATHVRFSPDGQRFIATTQDALYLWYITDFQAPPLVLEDRGGFNVVFSPDGRWLATASGTLWDITASTPVDPVILPRLEVIEYEDFKLSIFQHVAFSPDGRWLATAGEDAFVRLWDLTRLPTYPMRLRAQDEWRVESLAFSQDGQWLVAVNSDRTARLWHMRFADLVELACRVAGRNLTDSEWNQYFPGEQYRLTCSDFQAPGQSP